MGKKTIDNFFCLNGDRYLEFFLQKFLLSSPPRFIRLVQIAEFDWLPGLQKGVNFCKFFKKFSETIRWMKLVL